MILNYRSSPAPRALEQSERRAWIMMAIWIAAFLLIPIAFIAMRELWAKL